MHAHATFNIKLIIILCLFWCCKTMPLTLTQFVTDCWQTVFQSAEKIAIVIVNVCFRYFVDIMLEHYCNAIWHLFVSIDLYVSYFFNFILFSLH